MVIIQFWDERYGRSCIYSWSYDFKRSFKEIIISFTKDMKKILERFQMQNCKLINTSITKGESLSCRMCPRFAQEKEQMRIVFYSSVVGSLMYVMMCIRPDICFPVGMVSRYQSNPWQAHWKAIKRILRYLKGTYDYS